MKKLYLTTTLPYVNSQPHIWHCLEFVQADAIVRFFRQKLGQENVFFNVWTDEHGQKILEKAKQEWLEVIDFCDKYSNIFKNFCEIFDIAWDNFYRTSDSFHNLVAQKFWQKSLENWDIYKKKYYWLYCIWCESFKTEKDLINGKCPDHNQEPIKLEEENYFFRMSKYKDILINYLDKNKYFVKPCPVSTMKLCIYNEIVESSCPRWWSA